MELFSYADILKASMQLGLCKPGKRAPNWPLKTKGYWSKKVLNNSE
jgi:hypothetical protein